MEKKFYKRLDTLKLSVDSATDILSTPNVSEIVQARANLLLDLCTSELMQVIEETRDYDQE